MENIASTSSEKITVETAVAVPVEKAWRVWTSPEHITKWNFASDDWQSPTATNDLRVGGGFTYRMEAKDGSVGFDFSGTYEAVKENELITYTMTDGRKVEIKFIEEGSNTRVVETFDAENSHSIELQRGGWQAILDNYKKEAESA